MDYSDKPESEEIVDKKSVPILGMFVCSAVLLMIYLVLVLYVPPFQQRFMDLNLELPSITILALTLSHWACRIGIFLLLPLMAFTIFLHIFLKPRHTAIVAFVVGALFVGFVWVSLEIPVGKISQALEEVENK
jgi:hypothetical protein